MIQIAQLRLQLAVFALVAAAFTNIYVTQPVLPILQTEFGVDAMTVAFTVSAVILGIALSNLPFGLLADRFPVRPIILSGGFAVALAGLLCAVTESLWVLIGARLVQGLFIPALTTCLAAYLARTLPVNRLKIVMGAYVSATVLGGLGGRLLGGWIHPPLHWRYAFVTAALLTVVATVVALRTLPRGSAQVKPGESTMSYWALLGRAEYLRIYFSAAAAFAVFSSIFNYLPFRLAAPPFTLSTEMTTLLYLVYIIGMFMGAAAGRISNHLGSGTTLLGGLALVACALLLVLLPSLLAIVCALVALCVGYFALHAAAVGALNAKLSSGQGRANALYVLFYYLGGWLGITVSGVAYTHAGWPALIALCLVVLAVPLWAALAERKAESSAAD